jgi:nitric oxide reductase activation protein
MKSLGGRTVWLAMLGLAIGSAGLALAQQPVAPASSGQASQSTAGSNSSGRNSAALPAADDQPPDILHRTPDQLIDIRNSERQKKLIADTERLLELANQLKTDVDKSSKDTMSMDVIKKADEIEKLAHSVKEKMKGD